MQFCLSEGSRVVVVEIGEQPRVELLNLCMALLIEGINSTFALGDETFRGPWPTYSVSIALSKARQLILAKVLLSRLPRAGFESAVTR